MRKISYILLLSLFVFRVSWAQTDTVSIENTVIPEIKPHAFNPLQVGATDLIHGSDMMRSAESQANLSLAGLASGLYSSKTSWGTATGWATLKIRGLSRGNMADNPLIVVDGIPNRNISSLSIESIESISILKDVTSKMLYGSQAANGVIHVKTKRGEIVDRKLSFSVESGIKTASFLPTYLDAYNYAAKYNEARANDGLQPLYSTTALDHYKNQTSPLLYPDMDYYGTFLKDFAHVQRINSTLSGGIEKTRYFLNLEYVHESGLEAVGKTQQFNQLNLISNLDYKVNDIISMNLDILGRIGMHSGSRLAQNEMFAAMSSHRPNDYPFFVTHNQQANTDSLAFNTRGASNLYGQLTRYGYLKNQDFTSQTTLGIIFDLNTLIKGLTASVNLGFDSYNNIYYGKTLEYATYRIARADSLVRIGEDEIKSTESKFYDDFYRNVAGNGKINYSNSFGKHTLNAQLLYSMHRLAYKSIEDAGDVKQDIKGITTALNLNYAFNNRYVIELDGSYLGSDKFERGKRFKPFGAVGAAWILSNENFMESVSLFDYVKLKASYGIMGYDQSFDYYIYQNAFNGGGAYYFGINNDGLIDYGFRISKIGNPDVTFEEAKELNAGFEAVLAGNKITLEANYFNNVRSGMPTTLRSSLPGYVSGAAPIGNYNEVQNAGFDMAIQFQDNFGDLFVSAGGNLMYSKAVYNIYDELNYYQHLNRAGKAADVLFGFQADGLYTSEQDIANYGVTSSYSKLKPGDIKYVNLTNDLNDNVIDEFDVTEIGHFFPRFNYSLNANLAYKGFELYLLGQGVADFDIIRNTPYFFNYGERKYSEEILSDGYPRLTTATSGGHSFQNSTYWLQDASYFKLRVAELSYILPASVAKKIKAQKIRLFIRGTDLFTISKFDKPDPEDINAGITKYPLMKTGSMGAKIIF